MSGRRHVAGRFDAAAASYESVTPIQREIAAALADEIVALGLPAGSRVAELGCGTGYLTRALLPRLQPRAWLASDIAPAMLAALDRNMGHPGLATARIDAAAPNLEPGFDLVCSSLALQWLADPAGAVWRWRALARPGGWLAFSTLVQGSFGEWRQALAAAGAAEPGPAFAGEAELAAWLGPAARIKILTRVEHHLSGLDFLRAARAAGIDAGFGRALGPGVMRRAIRAFEAGGGGVTYRAAIVLHRVQG